MNDAQHNAFQDYTVGQFDRVDSELAAMKQANAEAIAAAVEAGIMAAASNPALWQAAGAAMRQQAQSAAGGWLLGGLFKALKQVAWIAVFVLAAYQFAGWAGVMGLLKTQAVQP